MTAGPSDAQQWFHNRPQTWRRRWETWRGRWRAGAVRATERALTGLNPFDWHASDLSVIAHLPSVRAAVEGVEVLEPARLLPAIRVPDDAIEPAPDSHRGALRMVRLRGVRMDVGAGLIRLPSGHLYFTSDGLERLVLARGGLADEAKLLQRPGQPLPGRWVTVAASQYFYHHLIDSCVPLLQALQAEPGLQVAVPAGQPGWYYDVLRALGVAPVVLASRVIDFEHVAAVRRVLLDESDVALLRAAARGAGVLRDAGSPGKRLLLTRRGEARHDPLLEDQLRAELLDLGFVEVDPGALSFQEQVDLFAQAELVVSPHGAALTNVIWSSRARGVVEILGSGYRGLQFARLCVAAGVPYTPIVDPAPGAVRSAVLAFS